jgi:hypothetical protein
VCDVSVLAAHKYYFTSKSSQSSEPSLQINPICSLEVCNMFPTESCILTFCRLRQQRDPKICSITFLTGIGDDYK